MVYIVDRVNKCTNEGKHNKKYTNGRLENREKIKGKLEYHR